MKIFSEEVNHLCFLYPFAAERQLLTSIPEEADFLLLPFQYECIYGSFAACNSCYGVNQDQYLAYQLIAERYERLSLNTGIPLIVFFYNDSDSVLPFTNAIIFRTSWHRSRQENNVFGMPAFVEELPQNDVFTILEKTKLPEISFRGQSAPLRLPFKTWIRVQSNKLLEKTPTKFRFKLWYDDKLLLRRKAILLLKKVHRNINIDFELRGHFAAHAHPQKNDYLNSLSKNAYILCVSGWGNYSYRFYESLREGRIPAFIDTDCLLPCADLIDWRSLIVWVPEKKVGEIAGYVLNFHGSLTMEAFRKKQEDIRAVYYKYLTKKGFAKYLLEWLNKRASEKENLNILQQKQFS